MAESEIRMEWDRLESRMREGSALYAVAVRPLTPAERELLEAAGNRCSDWTQVWAGPGFDPSLAGGCRFRGRVVLGCAGSGGVWDSTLEDAEVGEGTLVDRAVLVRRTVVYPGALLRGCLVDCSSPATFGLDGEIQGGLETSGREIPFFAEGTLEDYTGWLDRPREAAVLQPWHPESRFSVIGPGTQVTGGHLDRVWAGSYSRFTSATAENSCILSSREEPAVLGPGVLVRDSLVQWGCQVDSGAQVFSSVLLEHSGAERQALVTGSLLGPNTHVGEGEVTASLVGPFVGMHHHSLLIAAWWPEGGGNLGYGANVGSNHTGRLPDQEIRPGEGMFFGLGVNVKFPGNYTGAPYTLAATGLTLPPQRLELPFSLIVPGDDPGNNRVLPGWVLGENLYALFRNRKKYLTRNKARRSSPSLDPFRKEIVEKVWKTWEELGRLCGKDLYTPGDWAGIGAGMLGEEDRISGVSAYETYLKYTGLRGKLVSIAAEKPADPLTERVLSHFFPGLEGKQAVLGAFLREFDGMILSVEKSRGRDWLRGEKILDDYRKYHGNPEDDPVIAELKRERILWASGKVPE